MLEQHFTLYLFDQRGTGKSSKTKSSVGRRQMSADLIAIMDAVGLVLRITLGRSTWRGDRGWQRRWIIPAACAR